jgi:hypothetical protein
LEIPIPELPWPELCKVVCDKFEKDQHNSLLRQFFRIKQTEGVVDYIEHFDSIVHQILAHDPKFSTSTITNRFIDGLKDEIRAVVLVHRPGNLDTASSIALLQEESSKDAPRIEFRKHDFKYSNRASSSTSNRAGSSTFTNTAGSQSNGRNGDSYYTPAKRASENSKGAHSDEKMTTLMNYRKAKGLCYKCGMKWNPGHKCANSVSLHVVEELWQMICGD